VPLHDTSYKHWTGAHLGVWRRRLTIARNGVAACLQNRWMRHLLLLCWSGALLMALALFAVGQLLVADSVVVEWVGNFNPRLQTFARMLTTWLEEHPEISVRTTQNVLFYYFSTGLLKFSIFAIGMIIPVLITRDLASNAIVIYSSKAINRGDYVFGKFATVAGLMGLAWLGPVCAAWFVGNLLAPDWRFFWHSRGALLNVLLFGICGVAILGFLALGVSAVSSREKSTSALWYIWWIVGGIVSQIVAEVLPWLRHFSFNYNLEQIALSVFRLGDDLKRVQDNIPIFGDMLRNVSAETMSMLNAPEFTGAAVASCFMMGLALAIVAHRSRPE